MGIPLILATSPAINVKDCGVFILICTLLTGLLLSSKEGTYHTSDSKRQIISNALFLDGTNPNR